MRERMHGTSRRSLLAAGTAGMLLGATGGADAAAPMAGGQAPGFYRFMVGGTEVTLVGDGFAKRPLDAGFVRNAPFDEVKQVLAQSALPDDSLTITFTATLLNTGSQLVLIDTGNGQFGAPTSGQLLSNLAASGYRPEQVDLVIASHFHGDHINGIRDKEGKLVFPNAKLAVPEAEWAFWMDDAQMAKAPDGMKPAFANVRRVFAPIAGEVQKFAADVEVAPGLKAMAAYGHTPGHTAFMLGGGSDRLLIWSDTTNRPELFVRRPGWHAVFDMDPAMAEANRRRLLELAASERLPVVGYHFPPPAKGAIVREEDGFRYITAS